MFKIFSYSDSSFGTPMAQMKHKSWQQSENDTGDTMPKFVVKATQA
jgi:hypothetical protein